MPNKKILTLVLMATLFVIPMVAYATTQVWYDDPHDFTVTGDPVLVATYTPLQIKTKFQSRVYGGLIDVNTVYGGSNHRDYNLDVGSWGALRNPSGATTYVFVEFVSVATKGTVLCHHYTN